MDQTIKRITGSRLMLESHLQEAEPFHGAIKRQVMASVVHYSTKIEGNRLTREQVEAIIAGEAIEAPEKDKVEATNYLQAMRWAQTRAVDPEWRMTHETVLTLHFLVSQNLGSDYEPLGRYRERQNGVSDRRTGTVIYWPPRSEDVRQLMDDFVDWCRRMSDSGLDPYIANALAHLNLVAIHPFSDGNGRVTRVLCSLLMMRDGYRAQAFYSLEEYFGVNWHEYGQQIERTLGPRWDPERVDCTRWIEWYLDAIATQVSEAEQRLREAIGTLAIVYAGFLVDGFDGARKAVAVWLALREGEVTNRSYRMATDVSAKTASDELRALSNADYLIPKGKGRGSKYVLGPKVNAWGPYDELVDVANREGVQSLVDRIAMRKGEPRLFEP